MRFDLIRNRFVSSFTFGSSNETLGGVEGEIWMEA